MAKAKIYKVLGGFASAAHQFMSYIIEHVFICAQLLPSPKLSCVYACWSLFPLCTWSVSFISAILTSQEEYKWNEFFIKYHNVNIKIIILICVIYYRTKYLIRTIYATSMIKFLSSEVGKDITAKCFPNSQPKAV